MFFVQQNSPFGAGLSKRLSLYTKPSNPFPASKRSAWTKANAKKSGGCFQGWRMSWRCGMPERRRSRPYRASAYHGMASGHDLCGKIPRFKRGNAKSLRAARQISFFRGKTADADTTRPAMKRGKTTRWFRNAFVVLGDVTYEAFLGACVSPASCPYRASVYRRLGSGHDLRGKIPRFKRGNAKSLWAARQISFFRGKTADAIQQGRQ